MQMQRTIRTDHQGQKYQLYSNVTSSIQVELRIQRVGTWITACHESGSSFNLGLFFDSRPMTVLERDAYPEYDENVWVIVYEDRTDLDVPFGEWTSQRSFADDFVRMVYTDQSVRVGRKTPLIEFVDCPGAFKRACEEAGL